MRKTEIGIEIETTDGINGNTTGIIIMEGITATITMIGIMATAAFTLTGIMDIAGVTTIITDNVQVLG